MLTLLDIEVTILVLVLFFHIDQNIHKGHILFLCQKKKNSKQMKKNKNTKQKVKYIPWKASSIWMAPSHQLK